jgi:SOS-response transcriptional repressor LexA
MTQTLAQPPAAAESLDLERLFVSRHPVGVFITCGSRMEHRQIADGDFVVVELRDNPRPGDIVAASAGGTMPELWEWHSVAPGGLVRLEKLGREWAGERDRVRVVGVAVGVIRRM